MYIVRDYLTNTIVAFTSRKEDALAMVKDSGFSANDPKLIIETEKATSC